MTHPDFDDPVPKVGDLINVRGSPYVLLVLRVQHTHPIKARVGGPTVSYVVDIVHTLMGDSRVVSAHLRPGIDHWRAVSRG